MQLRRREFLLDRRSRGMIIHIVSAEQQQNILLGCNSQQHKSNQMKENLRQQMQYDPFANPPDFNLAEIHHQAKSVGIPIDDADILDTGLAQKKQEIITSKLSELLLQNTQQNEAKLCPCCGNPIQKKPLSLCCPDESMLFLGVGYPLYFKLARYYTLILIFIFFISGSAIYFLVTLNCKERCFKFMGIPIYNPSLDSNASQSEYKAQIINIVTAICIFLIVIYVKTWSNESIIALEDQIQCPSVYTVMVQNLPPDIPEEQLLRWVQTAFGEKPVLVNYAYDVTELDQAYSDKQSLSVQFNKNKLKELQFKEQMEKDQQKLKNKNQIEIQKIKLDNQKKLKQFEQSRRKLEEKLSKTDQILSKYKKQEKQCNKIGTAFLTFNTTQTVNMILQKYERSFFYSVFSSITSIIKKSRLYCRDRIVVVSKAPAPREIIWQYLQFSYFRSFAFEMLFIASMILLIYAGLQVQFYFVGIALGLKQEGMSTGRFITILEAAGMSIIIVILNAIIRLVILIFTSLKGYASHTTQQASFCMYYAVFYVLNSCFTVYIVHGQLKDDTDELLLMDIHFIMLTNALSQPLFKLFDPIMWGRAIWRKYVHSKGQRSPYTQQYVNQLWQGYNLSNGDNYQYITRVILISAWFAHICPLGVIFSIVGMVCDYGIIKGLLLRFYRIPENVSADVAKPSLMSLELLPLAYICGVMQWRYKVGTDANILQFIFHFLNYGVTFVVIFLCIIGYVLFCKKIPRPNKNLSYRQSCLAFGDNYETANPMTKLKGQLNFLRAVLGTDQPEEDHSVSALNQEDQLERSRLKEILEASMHSIDVMELKRSEIRRIKLKMKRKISKEKAEVEMGGMANSRT